MSAMRVGLLSTGHLSNQFFSVSVKHGCFPTVPHKWLVPLTEKSCGKYMDLYRLMASGRCGKMKSRAHVNAYIFYKDTDLLYVFCMLKITVGWACMDFYVAETMHFYHGLRYTNQCTIKKYGALIGISHSMQYGCSTTKSQNDFW
jgi:hypothetical protein